jgi:hypothetical protein
MTPLDEARVARRSEKAWDRVLVGPAASGGKAVGQLIAEGGRYEPGAALKLGACLPSSIVPAIVDSNIKSWADAQRQPAPRARWLSSFGRRCGRSGN